jgi:hypothetical protein
MSAKEDFPWSDEAKNLREGLPSNHKRNNQTPNPQPNSAQPVEGEKEDETWEDFRNDWYSMELSFNELKEKYHITKK